MRNQVLNTEFPAVRKMAGIARSSCKAEGIAPLNSRKNLPGSGACTQARRLSHGENHVMDKALQSEKIGKCARFPR